MIKGRIFSWLLLLFGEALIITSFIIFRGSLATNILSLNIIVTTIVYGLFFVDIWTPWINLHDNTQKRVGSIGVRWFVTWLYAIAAIGFMLVANIYYHLSFLTQLPIQGILLFFLFLGLLASSHAQSKANDTFYAETANRNGILEMQKSMLALKDRISESEDLPDSFKQRINALHENLRFISPAGNSIAQDLENSFVEATNDIRLALTNYTLNEQQIEGDLKKCERLYLNRKQIYSN